MQWQDQAENQSIVLWLKLLVTPVWVMMRLVMATGVISLHKFCCTH